MKDVVVVGAGLAGLHCARLLQGAGLDVAVLEKSDAPGGRVRTDVVDGFLLDRGFQVLLTAYPETQKALDYTALDLKELKPGALVFHGGRFHRFADPFREPLAALKLAVDPIVTFGDKLGVARLRARVTSGSIESLFTHEETTTRSFLERYGFSGKIIERFFEPFFGGVFLEKDLATSSRYFEFLFRMFSTGAVAVPARGMGKISEQLAERLQPGSLRLDHEVRQVSREGDVFQASIRDADGLSARAVVIATEEPETRRLLVELGGQPARDEPRSWNCTTALYFAAEETPVALPILMLNGEGRSAGPVNNAVVLTQVSSGYAPPGAQLISASVVGTAATRLSRADALESEVRDHLTRWFGPKVQRWQLVGARPVVQALPLQTTAAWEAGNSRGLREGVFLCGDFLETASIQGSLASGRRAASAALDFFGR